MSYCDQCAKLLREIATLRADATKAAEELARAKERINLLEYNLDNDLGR